MRNEWRILFSQNVTGIDFGSGYSEVMFLGPLWSPYGSPGCRIIDNGLFGQISVRTAFKPKLAGKVFEQKPAGTMSEQKPAGTVF